MMTSNAPALVMAIFTANRREPPVMVMASKVQLNRPDFYWLRCDKDYANGFMMACAICSQTLVPEIRINNACAETKDSDSFADSLSALDVSTGIDFRIPSLLIPV